MNCPRNFTFMKEKLSEIRLTTNIEPEEVNHTYLIKECSVEVLNEGEQRQTRNTADIEMENEEDCIDEAFHTEFTADWMEN